MGAVLRDAAAVEFAVCERIGSEASDYDTGVSGECSSMTLAMCAG